MQFKMCAKTTIIFLLALAIGVNCGPLQLEEVTASLASSAKVAQCRALCIDEFVVPSNPNPSADSECMEHRDCYMCWDSCQYFGTNFETWKDICRQPHICLDGCQLACSYYENDPSLGTQIVVLPHLKIAESTASWNLGLASSETSAIVWILLVRENLDSDWKEVAQTVGSHASIKYLYVTKATTFRVMGVSGTRIVADEMASATDTEINESYAKSETWPLFLLSMSANEKRSSVDVVVTWEPRSGKSDYLVTWDVSQDGFGIKGHLYTDTNMVTLSLWPDSVYEVQVDADGVKSAPLLVDTHTVEAVKVVEEDNEHDLLNDYSNEVDNSDASTSSPSAAGEISLGDHWELAIGVGAGLVSFVVILLAAIVYRRYRARRDDAFKETRFHDSLEYSPNAFVARRIFVPAQPAVVASPSADAAKQGLHSAVVGGTLPGRPVRKSTLNLDLAGFLSSSTTSLSSCDYEDGGLLRANASTVSCLGSYASCHQIDACPVILNVADLQPMSRVHSRGPGVASHPGTMSRIIYHS